MRELSYVLGQIERPAHRAIEDYAATLGYRDMISLGQGRPCFPIPSHVIEATQKAVEDGYTNYTPELGYLDLREAFAEDLRVRKGLDVDPKNEIMITSGAAEAIFTVYAALSNPSDEFIIPEICYPQYFTATTLLRSKSRFVPMNKNTFGLDLDAMNRCMNEKTKILIADISSDEN